MHIGVFVSIRIPYGWIKESNCLRWARLVGARVGGGGSGWWRGAGGEGSGEGRGLWNDDG